ncbi:MAG: pyridoxal-phosphate dependent enzyme [Bacteroidales bacterium]|nr:pyridoxal-phosphate dependent enzyme [Bacteroidales bacterium]
MKGKFVYQCVDCGETYTDDKIRYLCPVCSKSNTKDNPPKGVLKVLFDYEDLNRKNTTLQLLKNTGFLDLFPISKLESLPNLKVGNTALIPLSSIDGHRLKNNVFIKDDSLNATYSFKDRASAVVSAFAKEHGIDTIITASTGNAGSSLAGICAAQHQKAVVLVPEMAPLAKLTQILMYGATLVPVKGTYDDAFDLSVEATENLGWYNRNTAYNPLTIEGKKTVSFELLDQMDGKLPDKIYVPVGDGVIISGVYKGFEDLHKLNIIDHIPVIVAVQSAGSANLVNNLNNNSFSFVPSRTVADSISVDIPRNFYMAQQFLKKYRGETLLVSDEEILNASAVLSRNTGLFAEPAAVTAFAGMLKDNAEGNLVVLSTGSGLKDLQAVQQLISMPGAIVPELEHLMSRI